MSDIISYNLSILAETKESIDISSANLEESKTNVSITTTEPTSEKTETDISSDIPSPESSETAKSEIDINNWDNMSFGGALGNVGAALMHAKVFPLDPIDPNFKLTIIENKADKTVIKTDLSPQVNPDGKYTEEVIEDHISPSYKFKVLNDSNELEEVQMSSNKYAKTVGDDVLESVTPTTEFRVLEEDGGYREFSSVTPGANVKAVGTDSSNIIRIIEDSPYIKRKLIKEPYSDTEYSYTDIRDALNKKEATTNLGAIHVYPVNPSDEGGISSKYVIPFEFNPAFTESGRSAKYESMSLMSRIGDIHSYIKTESMTISFNTKYQVLHDEKHATATTKVGDHQGVGSWMKDFTLANLQRIEMAYRGLVYPQSSRESGNYFRPPLIKVVFDRNYSDGTKADGVTPFNNLLTYPYVMNKETKIYHKSFIVSKVDIKKDWDNTPIIMNENNNGILDLQGFEVSLELMEVDPMYIGVLPTFEDYYSLAEL